MNIVAISTDALQRSLTQVVMTEAVIILRCLKEAAIRDQSFELAQMLRDMERQMSGTTGINAKRPRSRKQPRTAA